MPQHSSTSQSKNVSPFGDLLHKAIHRIRVVRKESGEAQDLTIGEIDKRIAAHFWLEASSVAKWKQGQLPKEFHRQRELAKLLAEMGGFGDRDEFIAFLASMERRDAEEVAALIIAGWKQGESERSYNTSAECSEALAKLLIQLGELRERHDLVHFLEAQHHPAVKEAADALWPRLPSPIVETPYDVGGLANPFLGLNAFTYNERERYAGRTILVKETLKKLTSPGQQRSLFFVTGASGSGKSSFVQAAMVPALEDYYKRQGYAMRWAIFEPSAKPLIPLVHTLYHLGLAAEDILADPSPHLESSNFQTHQNQVGLLVLDQYERFFVESDSTERDHIFAWLAALPPFSTLALHMIASLRKDYLPDLYDHTALYEEAKRGIDLRAMAPDDLEEAIQRPLYVLYPSAGKRFEPALVQRMANDATADAAFLPLLQVSLEDLWKRGRLTLEAYHGLAEAISRRADYVLSHTLVDGQMVPRPEAHQKVLLQILVALGSEIEEAGRVRYVRRHRTWQALVDGSTERAALIEEWVDRRLLTKSLEVFDREREEQVVTLIHDALISHWPRLQFELGIHRALLQRRERFEQRLQEWRAFGYLLEGSSLAEAEELDRELDVALRTSDAQTLLKASIQRRERRTRLLQVIVVVLALLLIAAVVASLVATRASQGEQRQSATAVAALSTSESRGTAVAEQVTIAQSARNEAEVQRQDADHQRQVAEARNLATQASAVFPQPRSLSMALLLGVESLTHALTPEGDQIVRQALSLFPHVLMHTQITPSSSIGLGALPSISDLAFSPDGRWLAASSSQGQVIEVWDTQSWKVAQRISFSHAGTVPQVRKVVFGPDSSWLVSGVDTGEVQVWDVATGRELARQEHEGQVFALAVSPDGEFIASGASGSVVVWERATGRPRYQKQAGTNSLAFSPDGRFVAAAGEKSVTVWYAQNGELLYEKRIVEEADDLYGVTAIGVLQFSPDSKLLSAGLASSLFHAVVPRPLTGGKILVWETETGEDVAEMQHTDEVHGLNFSVNPATLISGSYDGTVKVWDYTTGKVVRTLQADAAVDAIAYLPQMGWIVAAAQDGTVHLWEMASGREINRLVAGKSARMDVLAVSRSNALIATGDNLGRLWVWTAGGEERQKFEHGTGISVSAIDFSPDGKWLTSGAWDRSARLWSLETGKETVRVDHEAKVLDVLFSPDGRYVASVDISGTLKLWEVATGRVQLEWSTSSPTETMPIGSVTFSANGRWLAASHGNFPRDGWFLYPDGLSSAPSSIRIWQIDKRQVVAELHQPSAVNTIAFTPDGRRLVTGSDDRAVRIWDLDSQHEIARMWHQYRVNIVKVSPDGALIASAEACYASTQNCSPMVKVWDAATHTELWSARLPAAWIGSLLFSPDSKTLVASNNCIQGQCQNAVYVWETTTGKLLNKKLHEGYVIALTMNRDGQRILSGGGNGQLYLWETATGQDVARIEGYTEYWTARFSPDERLIALAGYESGVSYVRLIPIQSADLVALGCQRVAALLDDDEWQPFLADPSLREVCPGYAPSPQTPVLVEQPQPLPADSQDSWISADGRFVVFTSEAPMLVCDDTNAANDIFVFERETGKVTRASVATNGHQSDGTVGPASISADGRYVAFSSDATNLADGDTNFVNDVFLYDRQRGETLRVSATATDAGQKLEAKEARISGDGRYILYVASPANLAISDADQHHVVYIYSRGTGQSQVLGDSDSAEISFTGDFVVLAHGVLDRRTGKMQALPKDVYDWRMMAGDRYLLGRQKFDADGSLGESELEEIVLFDLVARQHSIVSQTADGQLANRDSDAPALSANGSVLVFSSEATNLASGDTNAAWDIFAVLRQTGQIMRISMGISGVEANGNSSTPSVSTDGRYVAFTSKASNLVAGDRNGSEDAFLYDRETKQMLLASPSATCLN